MRTFVQVKPRKVFLPTDVAITLIRLGHCCMAPLRTLFTVVLILMSLLIVSEALTLEP